MRRIRRSAIVERSVARLYAIVEDIESYPRFVPHCIAAHVHERSAARTVATLVFGVPPLRASLTTENVNSPGESIRMRLREGPFRHFAAAWRFAPLGPDAARVDFTLEYEFANRLAERTLGPLFERLADTIVEAFHARALRDDAA
ncbi:MAG: type II toxin-antitoxin system RatA family toxin [Burkholderiales bacterium]|nr:type II toxin-antitoxin system RatA family toxin [Burkholderiales bacterium]